MKEGISVIICCYNSVGRITNSLTYLSRQIIKSDIAWEIIIVNNASTDNIEEVAYEAWKKLARHDVDFRIVDQAKQGLSFARQKGIEESIYEIILFCDDDNGLHENYVETVWEIMKFNSSIGALGGYGLLPDSSQVPKWLKGFEEFYAVGPQGNTSGDVTDSRGCLYGAGLAIRKEVLKKLHQNGFHSILSDRTKTELLSGGDTELTFAIRLLGYRLWYDERLKFYHFISLNRFTKRYFFKLIFYIGYSWMALQPYHNVLNQQRLNLPSPNWKDVLYILRRAGTSLILSLAGLVIFRFAAFRERIFNAIFHFGELYFAVKNYGRYKTQSVFLTRMLS